MWPRLWRSRDTPVDKRYNSRCRPVAIPVQPVAIPVHFSATGMVAAQLGASFELGKVGAGEILNCGRMCMGSAGTVASDPVCTGLTARAARSKRYGILLLQFAGCLADKVAHELGDTHLVLRGEAFPPLVFSRGDGDDDFHALQERWGRFGHWVTSFRDDWGRVRAGLPGAYGRC